MFLSPAVLAAGTAPDLVSALNARAVRKASTAVLTALAPIEVEFATSVRSAARHLVGVLSWLAEDATGGFEQAQPTQAAFVRQLAVMRGSQAGVDGWAAEYGFAVGSVAATVAAVKELTGGTSVAPPVGLGPLLAHVSPSDLNRAVADAMREHEDPLARVKSGMQLSDAELGGLFGVSRQAASQWLRDGIPSQRMAALGDVVATVDLLERKLKPGRLPLTAKRSGERLGGRTLLEALTIDPAGTRRLFEDAFDWAASA